MTRSEVIHHLYAVFNTHPLYDINLVKLNNILDEVEAHEREECRMACLGLAKKIKAEPSFFNPHLWEGGTLDGLLKCADAIRARGQV